MRLRVSACSPGSSGSSTLSGEDFPPYEAAPFDYGPPEVTELDLAAEGVSTVVWTSGYRPAFDWIELPASMLGLTRGQTSGLTFIGRRGWSILARQLIGLVRDAEPRRSLVERGRGRCVSTECLARPDPSACFLASSVSSSARPWREARAISVEAGRASSAYARARRARGSATRASERAFRASNRAAASASASGCSAWRSAIVCPRSRVRSPSARARIAAPARRAAARGPVIRSRFARTPASSSTPSSTRRAIAPSTSSSR